MYVTKNSWQIADTSLGKDYDVTKLQKIESLQIDLHKLQAEIAKKHDNGELNDKEFVNELYRAIKLTFKQCEDILGTENFQKLFLGHPDMEFVVE